MRLGRQRLRTCTLSAFRARLGRGKATARPTTSAARLGVASAAVLVQDPRLRP